MSVTPREVRLSEIAARLEAAGLVVSRPDADPVVRGISDDSRRVERGDLFCAWAGTRSDGHRYAGSAEEAGAVALLAERRLPELALPQLVVRDGRRAAALAAALVFGDPADRLTLVGVTGTNGKTTTAWLLRHLLGARYPAASLGTLGVVGADGALRTGEDALTTPGPVELARTLAGLVSEGVEAVAMEVSSHALDQGRVEALRFDAAVFTNLSRDHLDYHGTEEAYLAAKRSLVALMRPEGTAVVNAEDPAWEGLAESASRALRFGVSGTEAEVRAESVEVGSFGARFRLVGPGGEAPVSIPLLGAFNVQNALGAAGACLALGFTVEEVAARLESVPQVPGRLELIATAPASVLRDYAHTPDALDRTLRALRPLTAGRLIVVFGAGGDRDRGKRPLMGGVAERLADLAIVTSDNPRSEDPEAIIDEIETGMTPGRHVRITDRRAAIQRALAEAAPGDVVVLAGKGHETYQIVGTRKLPFDERAIVRELLGGHVPEVTA